MDQTLDKRLCFSFGLVGSRWLRRHSVSLPVINRFLENNQTVISPDGPISWRQPSLIPQPSFRWTSADSVSIRWPTSYYAARKHGYTVVRAAPFAGKALALAEDTPQGLGPPHGPYREGRAAAPHRTLPPACAVQVSRTPTLHTAQAYRTRCSLAFGMCVARAASQSHAEKTSKFRFKTGCIFDR